MDDKDDKKDDETTESESFDDAQNEEEIVEFEEGEADDGAGLLKKLKKLKAELKACQKEKSEYLTGWQKERADFANYRKEEDARRTNFKEITQEDILTRFLAVLDSFNMAFADKKAWSKVDDSWRKGVEYIYGQMNTAFEEYGVKEIGEVGETFDPNIHQSIEMISTDQKDIDHKVAEVTQKGYKLGPRVIRPARVNVYEYKEN